MAGISDVQSITATNPGVEIDLGAIAGAAVPVSITVFNAGANTVFLTPGGLDAPSGYPIPSGAVIRFSDKFDSNDTAELFCGDGATACNVHVDRGGVTDMQVLIKPADSLGLLDLLGEDFETEDLSLSQLLFSALGVYKVAAAPAPSGTNFQIEAVSGGPDPTMSTMLDGQQLVMLSGDTKGQYDLIRGYLNGDITHAATFTPAAGDLVAIGTVAGKIGNSDDEAFRLNPGIAGQSLFNALAWLHNHVPRKLVGADTAAADGSGGDTTVATAEVADCLVTGITVYANGAQTGDMTDVEFRAGPGAGQLLLTATQVQMNADGMFQSVDLSPGYLLENGESVRIVHSGTGATALSLKWVVTYTAAGLNGEMFTP